VERVTTVAYLVDGADDDLDLGPAVADRLAALGVTSLVLFRDGETLCVVLEGWAFDPSSASAAATAIGVETGARTLHPVMRTALRATG
jgi:hypothetical protein